MHGRFRFRIKNRIYVSYLISYLILSLILFILSLTGYKICEKTIVNEIKIAQNSILLQLQGIFDRNVESVIKAGQILAGNDRVQALGEEGSFDVQSHLEIQKLREELVLQLESVDICSDIMVYFVQNDTILTQKGVYAEVLKDLFYQSGDIQRADVEKMQEIDGLRGYFTEEDAKGEKELWFIENVYGFNLKEKRAIIAMRIPWARIQQLYLPFVSGNLYWLNGNNEMLIVSGEEEKVLTPSFKKFDIEGELLYTTAGGEKIISSFRRAERSDWKYCISMREKEYFAELNRMKMVIGIQMLLLLGAAIALALYYSSQQYSPVERILEAIRRNQKTGTDIQALKDVEGYLEKLCQENAQLTASWKKAQEVLAGEIVTGYIKGWNGNRAMVEETLSQRGVDWSRGYAVFLITLRDIGSCKLVKPEGERGHMPDSSDMELLEFVFRNIFEEMVQSIHKGILIRIDSNYLYLVSIGGDGLDQICEDMKRLSETYGNYLNLNLFIGGSGPHNSTGDLQRAYNEAVQALAYQTFWGNDSGEISLYEADCPSEEFTEGKLTNEYHKQLYNLMSAGQYENAAKLLDVMVNKIFIKDMRCTKINQCRMFGLINTVCEILTELLGRNDEEFLKELRPLERLLQEKSVDSAVRTMQELFREIMEHLKFCMEEKKPEWVQETMQEIEENFSDVNLSLSGLADKENLNLAYMSRTFKQYVGYSVPDYIHLIRIRECKRLLAEGVSVKDAAEMAGYVDAKTLIRVFKKQEGITPGQYKSKMGIDLQK